MRTSVVTSGVWLFGVVADDVKAASGGGTSTGVLVLVVCLVLVAGAFGALAFHNHALKRSYIPMHDTEAMYEPVLRGPEAS